MSRAGGARAVAKRKTLSASERERQDVAERRAEFARPVTAIPAADLVVDETGVATSMTRRYGRAPRGERVADAVPGGRWEVLTVLGAMTLDGMLASMAVPCATGGDVFLASARQVLAPALRPGQVVLLDSLGAHTVAGVREALGAAGCRRPCLPPYSPDLSPIELAWAKVKAGDARGFFRHCGYAV